MKAAAQHSAASGAAARAKPRPKKPKAAAPDAADPALDGDDNGDDAKLKPKRRRSAPKKKETDSDGAADARRSRTRSLFLQPRSLDDHRYARAPRLLPDIAGVKALSLAEANADIRTVQTALSAFDAKVAALLPPSAAAAALSGTSKDPAAADGDDASLLPGAKPRRARPTSGSAALTPEELVESLPACRRAVRLTQRELVALKRERDDLERDFMRLRSQYVQQVGAMKAMQKQHGRVARVLGRDVVQIAKGLESSRRRTNALQDIMTELEARGSSLVRLTREKRQLEALLAQHHVPLPEIDAVYVGDRVKCAQGVGCVLAMDATARTLTLELAGGDRVAVDEDDVEVLPVEISYADAERELKQSFFDKIGALVQPHGIVGITTSGRRHPRGAGAAVSDDDDESDDDDDDESDDDDDESGGDDDASDAEPTKSDADAEPPKPKKRKLTMMPPPGASSALKKRQKAAARVIDFPACTIPSTPFDMGLLLSPLSTLPDRVAAVGPGALQWKDAHLPSRMLEWEQERYDALQMKAEVERLRFQLQKAEAEKLDAQQHASDQLESINQLVMQLDKLRESMSASSSSAGGTNGAGGQCPHCSASSAGRKNSAAAAAKAASKASAAKSSAAKKEEAPKRQHRESIDVHGSEEAEKPEKKPRSDHPGDDGGDTEALGAKRAALREAAGDDEDDADAAGESSDGASSKPAPRSLRPRRKPTSNSTTASPKQSK
ncbi:hypothetical protein PybrP1_013221 [[Pythium] brassicae (nom. inval.)]|nr:hypothetical protein PybrP1_013221 [[Pythium] brassicae (nom. inval.)]